MDYSETLANGVVVVTGASVGLGRALCQNLMGRGVRVAGLARSNDPLQQLAKDAPEGLFLPVAVDVGDPVAVTEAFAKIRSEMGAVSVLINNAALYPRRDILEETVDSFMHTVEVNLGGMVACTAEALQDMVETGVGRIVNVTTYAGNGPAPAAAAYSVSKGACRIYTKALLADLGDRFPDIIINEWIPGGLNTRMGIPDGLDPADAARWGGALALMHARGISGMTFERDHSVQPPAGIKRRIVNRILGRERQIHLA